MTAGAFARAPRPGVGVALIVVMTVLFGTMDTTTRYLGAFMPVLLILWARYCAQALIMGVWVALSKSHSFRVVHPRFQLLRGTLLLATSAISFYGVQRMPVPEFTSIQMITPVLVTLLAAWLLHERVSSLRWALVVGCFVGALVVIRPGSGLFGWVVIFPIGAAIFYAGFQVLTSKLAAHEDPYSTHFYTGLTGTLILTPVLLLSGIDVDGTLLALQPKHLALIGMIGCFGTAGHLLLILALGLAPTSTLMPFVYVQIATAAGVGWLVFRTVPDGWAWIGMAIIAACGGASAWLNVRAARQPIGAVAVDATAD